MDLLMCAIRAHINRTHILKVKKTNIMIPKKNIDIFFNLLDKDSYYMFLKIENCCLKFFVKLCVGEKVY